MHSHFQFSHIWLALAPALYNILVHNAHCNVCIAAYNLVYEFDSMSGKDKNDTKCLWKSI